MGSVGALLFTIGKQTVYFPQRTAQLVIDSIEVRGDEPEKECARGELAGRDDAGRTAAPLHEGHLADIPIELTNFRFRAVSVHDAEPKDSGV
jgi:hypothetical protein